MAEELKGKLQPAKELLLLLTQLEDNDVEVGEEDSDDGCI